jgi:SWI/SNF-related matrix-associated actin-dependent regulator of chromatin subfamily A member 5
MSRSSTLLPLQPFQERKEQVANLQAQPRQWDVLVTSFEGVWLEKGPIQKIKWKYLVIDEAHRIKNEKSKLSVTVRELSVTNRLLITGTPLQNNLHELWALLNFLLPDVFHSSEDFDNWFSLADESGQENVIKKLHTILRPFMLRRIKNDVEHSLLPKIETKLYIGMSEMQTYWYKQLLTKNATALNSLGGPDKVRLLNVLMQLRKVCNHPYLFDGAEIGPPYTNGPHLIENSGKMVLLSKLLPKLKANSSRVLIFSQMTRVLDILEDFLAMMEYKYCRIDGSTKGDDRDSQMDEFNHPESKHFAFLLSTRAGGLGINLATADVVILFDSDWNPQVDLQAQDRAHRIGQKKQVRVFRLITEGTVEEKIVERADRKLYLDAAVIQQGRLAEQNKSLSKDEVMGMVKFGADEILKSTTGTITDEDIDALLMKGEERTKLLNNQIQSDMQHNLASFTLSAEDNFSLYDHGLEREKKDKGDGFFIALPQRDRKRNYNVNEYFRDALQVICSIPNTTDPVL